jgi:hypothetical protein
MFGRPNVRGLLRLFITTFLPVQPVLLVQKFQIVLELVEPSEIVGDGLEEIQVAALCDVRETVLVRVYGLPTFHHPAHLIMTSHFVLYLLWIAPVSWKL